MRQRFTIISDGLLAETDAAIEGDAIRISPDAVRDALGWELKPQGLCKADVCIPTHAAPSLCNADGIDLVALTSLLGQPLAADRDAGAACIGESARARATQLAKLRAPDFTLADLEGRSHSLSDYRGQRVLLVAWASWCGCRYDLPFWQALHQEYSANGFTIITVALDQSAADARPWIENAASQHPSLIDSDHVVAHRYGMINIPTMVWIDAAGEIVRPNDVALTNDMFIDFTGVESGPRMAAVRAWARDGALPAEPDARAQLMLPTAEEQLARAEFSLAWHLHQAGNHAASERHFARAAELSPNDWTIRRAAMPIRGIDPMGSPEMADLMREWIDAGRPYYRSRAMPE